MTQLIYSAQLLGLTAEIVSVEVDIARGWHSFNIVGLPDKAVEEARDRIGAAIRNIGLDSPHQGNRRIIASLAPAEIKKEGAHFDAAIALGYLLANKNIVFDPRDRIFFGELSLAGKLSPIKGALLLTQAARAAGFKEIFLPAANAAEAALVPDITVFGIEDLPTLISHLAVKPPKSQNPRPIRFPQLSVLPTLKPSIASRQSNPAALDLADIAGQKAVKRGLEIAAAGGHHAAMIGPPGAGKTMLARAFAGILPPLTETEVVEITGIHSVAGQLPAYSLMTNRPIRAPHHTASYAAIVGGGLWPRPGEISLAHRGVLFLDELAEFDRRVIEALRQPLEEKFINIARAKTSLTFPANFILLAAMNPCPCGYWGSEQKTCTCSWPTLQRYQRKLSGPIIDRLDLWLQVPAVPITSLVKSGQVESSQTVRHRVNQARIRQAKRFRSAPTLMTNSDMTAKDLNQLANLTQTAKNKLTQAAGNLNLSARAYHRVIKIARTIADLANSNQIDTPHILEALQYRPFKPTN